MNELHCYQCGSKDDVRFCQTGISQLCKVCRDKQTEELIIKTIPPQFQDKQSNHPKLEQYIKEPKSLFVWGNSGTGKTTFVCSLAKAYLRAELKVKILSYPKFIMELQGGFKDDSSPYGVAQRIAGYAGILIIDDIGAEKLTAFVQQISYFIINEREQYLLKTIITSNFSLQQIAEQIDVRIASRITGMCDILNFTGSDLRLKNRIVK